MAAEICSALLPRPLAAGHGIGATCLDWGVRAAPRSNHPVDGQNWSRSCTTKISEVSFVRVNLLSLQILLSDYGDLEKEAKIGKQTRGRFTPASPATP